MFAPPGVARLQAWVITRSPALTPSACAVTAKYQSMITAAIARQIGKVNSFICMLVLLERERFKVSEQVGGGMHRAEHPYDGKDRKSQGNLDDAIERESTKRREGQFIC